MNQPDVDGRMHNAAPGYTLTLACCLIAICLARPRHVQAQYHPEHPKVVEMVNRGVEYLTNGIDVRIAAYGEGEVMLAGYACFKATGDIDQPRAQAALQSAERMARRLAGMPREGESKIVYEAAVAVLMLAAVDPVKYRPELSTLLDWFFTIQKSHGGFGYLGQAAGDTSQTQYAMLALWTLNEAGLDVPPDAIVKAMRYLMATNERGGWAYQYEQRGSNFVAVSAGVTKSLSTAGIGALIVAGDALRLFGERRKENEKDDGLPGAFVRIDNIPEFKARNRASLNISRSDLEPIILQARDLQNKMQFGGGMWYYYWRYSEERYESFMEIVEGKQNKSPGWYNAGVEALMKGQDPEGSWGNSFMRDAATPIVVDTSFAILYLIRSTQKSIGTIDSGLAFGGYELPNDVSKVKMVGNRIVNDAEMSVENLLTMLEGDSGQVQPGLLPDDLQLSKDPTQRREQVSRLARLLRSEDANARRLAAKLLGRSDDLEQVPVLIYALSDPDPRVPMMAEESLRLLSRKLTSGKLGLDPDAGERAAAERFWKEWYLGLRPDFVF